MGTLTLSFRKELPRYACYLVINDEPLVMLGFIPAAIVDDPETGLVERDMWVAQMRRAFALLNKQMGLPELPEDEWEHKDFGHPYKDPKYHMN